MEKLNFKLSEFEGPLDLLLYLISKHKLNILDISISELLEQYMDFINQSKNEDLDIKSEFLEMAARLLNIKTLMLLPRHEEEAQQLRSVLTGELMELSLCKKAASSLLERAKEHVVFVRKTMETDGGYAYRLTHDKSLLKDAISVSKGRIIRKKPLTAENFSPLVKKRVVSVESRIIYLLGLFYKERIVSFDRAFYESSSKSEVVATFLAVLELIKAKRVEISDDGEQLLFTGTSGEISLSGDFA